MFAIANQKGYNQSERSAGRVSGGIWLCEIEKMPSMYDDM